MKYFAALLLIIGFVGIGVVGPMFFDMGIDHSGDCAASAIDGVKCPPSIMNMILHHISALQRLTTTILPPISGWLVLLASLLFITLPFLARLLLSSLQLASYRRIRDSFASSQTKQLIRWLALHENSPATL
jgi:hypothetical protein